MEKTENQENVTNKQRFLDRFSKANPDIDVNDEESYYGAINDQYDQNDQNAERLSEYEESERKLGEAFSADTRNAGLFLELTKKDGKPLEYLIDQYGDDFVALLNDPDNDEYRKLLADKHAADLKSQAEREALEKEAEGNIDATLDALDKVSEEMGLSDEEKSEAFEQMVSLINDLIRDKITEDVWRMFIKGRNYDADVEQANIEGEVRGRNTKIRERLSKQAPSALNTASSAGGSTPGTRSRKSMEGLGTDWFEDGQRYNK